MEHDFDGSVVIAAEIDDGGVKEGLASMRALLSSFAGYGASVAAEMQQSGNAAAASLPKSASAAAAQLASGLLAGRSAVGSAARGLLGAAQSVFTGAGGSFVQIGRGIVSEIASGISSAASGLFSTLRTLASNVVSVMQDALGIHSPSQVMRDAVGLNVGLGVKEGLLDSISFVAEAAGAVSGTLMNTLIGENSGFSGLGSGAVMRRGAVYSGGAAVSGVMMGLVGGERAVSGQADGKVLPSGNTFIFNKPVETPYAHAKEIRDTMEEILYGA